MEEIPSALFLESTFLDRVRLSFSNLSYGIYSSDIPSLTVVHMQAWLEINIFITQCVKTIDKFLNSSKRAAANRLLKVLSSNECSEVESSSVSVAVMSCNILKIDQYELTTLAEKQKLYVCQE